jgi:hypothetical protein
MRQMIIGLIFGIGLTVGATSLAEVIARVDTNGVLKGYTVQKNGKVVCKDPSVWLDFRGEGSFIVCD